MAFSFGFGGDDPDSDDNVHSSPAQAIDAAASAAVPSPPTTHSLKDLLSGLPERLSYSIVPIESPLGRVANLPRRELYDVRTQLLGEGDQDHVVDQLDKSDITRGVYEGGFKTWECSIDLARLLLDRGPRKDLDELVRCDQILELGAGTALPSLILFRHALLNSIPDLTFTFADYNVEVLRLVTLPNLLLTWHVFVDSPETDLNVTPETSYDLEITPSLLERFVTSLKNLHLEVKFISGAWSSAFANLVPHSAPDLGTLILAAETIYSPASTAAFVEVLATVLPRVKMAKAMVAAKRIYFGVGGSVDGFKEACREKGMVAYEIENHGVPGMDGGVGRALIEVQMF